VRSRLVIALAAIPCLLAFFSADISPILPLLISAVAIIGLGGFAIAEAHPLILSAAPICAYVLALVLTGDAVSSLSVLIFLPIAVVVALTLSFELSRTSSIIATSVSVLVYATVALLLVLPEGVSFSYEAFSDYIVTLRTALTEGFMTLFETEELSFMAGQINEETISSMIYLTLRLFPAAVIVGIEILAYFSCLIAVSARSSQFPEQPLPQTAVAFRMSSASATLFLICFVLSLFPTGRSDTVGILLLTALNLFVILLPGLALCGALRILEFFRQRSSFSLIVIIILLLWFSTSIPMILAFVGAFSTIRKERLAKRSSEDQK
ncbi:MAG: DUF2232 domain-containing protein, partial [Clostridia bacterium]|nr:DUF2232 domain-containing protein [Clostridia bacterium]